MIAASIAVVAATAFVKGAAAAGCSNSCYYEIKAEMEWTPERHPTDFPTDPAGFFSPFWTVAHDNSFYLWREGELANPGIQEIAEAGSGESFMSEVADCGDSCGPGEGIPCEPMGGTCKASGMVLMTPEWPYLTTATMHAPSPDWFTGIDSWELCKDGMWVEQMEKEVFPYDAGTDSGESFLSEDKPTTPPEPIFVFNSIMPQSNSIFYNREEGRAYPSGKIYATRIRCMDDDAGTYGS